MIYPFNMDEDNYDQVIKELRELPTFDELESPKIIVGSGEDFDYELLMKRSMAGDSLSS